MTDNTPAKGAARLARHTITIVPRYSETDQAGVVHHSVYPVWFEMGRTELLRSQGFAYSELEKRGIFFVVTELSARFRRPARYDETLELETVCSNVKACRIEHSYRLSRDGVVLAEGASVLACLDAGGRIRRIPEDLAVCEPI